MTPPPETDSLTGAARALRWVQVLIVGATLAAVGWNRFQSDYFERILETDELITLQNYTWLGIHKDGSRRELRTVDQLNSKPLPGLRQLALGIYCATGRWTEPNNHIPYSLSLNAALCLPLNTAQCARLPALFFSILFAIALARLSIAAGIERSWGIVTLLAFGHPYVAMYSQTARGYTLAMWLCAESLRLSQRFLLDGRGNRTSGVLLGVVGILHTANLVNMVVDWVAPLLVVLAGWLYIATKRPDASLANRLRQVWDQFAVVFVMTAVFCAAFLFDRFPYLISSAQQYGIAWSSSEDLFSYLSRLRRSLASGIWLPIGLFGGMGLLASVFSTQRAARVAAWCGLTVIAATALHFTLAGKFAYVRNLGVTIPLFAFGFGSLLDKVALRFRTPWPLWVGSIVVVTATLASGLISTLSTPQVDVELVKLAQFLSTAPSSGSSTAIVWGQGVAEPASLYAPAAVRSLSDFVKPSGEQQQFELWIVEKIGAPVPLQGTGSSSSHRVSGTAYRIRELHGRSRFRSDASLLRQSAAQALAWKAKDDSLPVSPAPILDALQKTGIRHVEINQRYQAKLDVFSRLELVLIPLHDEAMRDRLKLLDVEALQEYGDWFELHLD